MKAIESKSARYHRLIKPMESMQRLVELHMLRPDDSNSYT